MSEHAIIFTADGRGQCLYTEAIDLGRIGPLTIERATSIEFEDHDQCWHVRDPAGKALFRDPSRQVCLDWERQHLEAQEENKHE